MKWYEMAWNGMNAPGFWLFVDLGGVDIRTISIFAPPKTSGESSFELDRETIGFVSWPLRAQIPKR